VWLKADQQWYNFRHGFSCPVALSETTLYLKTLPFYPPIWAKVLNINKFCLGSVRGWLDGAEAFVDTMSYNPYGVLDGAVDGYGFTGEMTDDNGLVYLRARHYAPSIGSFVSLDPFEGMICSPMSFNGYSWVEGNVANWSDPSGLTHYALH